MMSDLIDITANMQAIKLAVRSSYDIVVFEDLNTVLAKPYGLQRLLAQHYQPVFGSQQRIVLFCPVTPNKQILQALKQAADFIDISPTFVLLVVPEDIGHEVIEVCGESDRFGLMVMDMPRSQTNLSMPVADTVCPLLWSHIEISEDGRCHPCCINQIDLGHVKSDQLSTIMQGALMTEIRQAMLTGNRHPSCQNCWINEDHGVPSMRQQFLKYRRMDFFSRWIDKPAVRSLDLKCGNTCNAKCRICNPWRSSLHLQEYMTFSTPDQAKSMLLSLENHKWFDEDSQHIRNQLRDLLPDIQNINVTGGEPFLIKSFDAFLRWIHQQGHASHIRLHFNSNGSIFPDRWIDILQEFQEIDIAFSIDDTAQRFEVQRTLPWHLVNQQIDKFMKLDPAKFHLSVWPVVSIMNVLYLEQLQNWAEDRGLDTPANQADIALIVLEDPWYFSIERMTAEAKDLACQTLSHSKFPVFRNLVQRIKNSPGSDGQDFCRAIKDHDQKRQENFAAAHPEISKAMGLI